MNKEWTTAFKRLREHPEEFTPETLLNILESLRNDIEGLYAFRDALVVASKKSKQNSKRKSKQTPKKKSEVSNASSQT